MWTRKIFLLSGRTDYTVDYMGVLPIGYRSHFATGVSAFFYGKCPARANPEE